MLSLAGVDASIATILENLSNGAALDKFKQMIEAQCGDMTELLASPEHGTTFTKTVVSTQAGYITSFDALTAGLLAMRAGAGRAVKSDVLDLDAGLKIFKKIGDPVAIGEPLFEILYNKSDFDADQESQVLLDAISISDDQIEIKEIVEIIK